MPSYVCPALLADETRVACVVRIAVVVASPGPFVGGRNRRCRISDQRKDVPGAISEVQRAIGRERCLDRDASESGARRGGGVASVGPQLGLGAIER